MEMWMIPVGLLLILLVVPASLLAVLGVVVLALKIVAVVQKAVEPPTVDQGNDYRLDQGQEVGRQE